MNDPSNSGLEITPPIFDPALYEDEPTGLMEALEMIERKFGLPSRKPKPDLQALVLAKIEEKPRESESRPGAAGDSATDQARESTNPDRRLTDEPLKPDKDSRGLQNLTPAEFRAMIRAQAFGRAQ